MELIKMDYYLHVKGMILIRINGRQLHLFSFLEQQPLLLNMDNISIYLEDILAITIEPDL